MTQKKTNGMKIMMPTILIMTVREFVITKISDNKYSFSFGYYTGSNWYNEPSTTGQSMVEQ